MAPRRKFKLCDLQNLAHLSHLFLCPCLSHSAIFVPLTRSPATELMHVLFPLTVMFFSDFFY